MAMSRPTAVARFKRKVRPRWNEMIVPMWIVVGEIPIEAERAKMGT